MKILHTSDLHLGISLGAVRLTEFQQKLPEIMAETIKKENIGCVIISGDVFDRSQGSAEAYRIYNSLLNTLCLECKVPVMVISGNHDSGARIAAFSELVRSGGLHLFGGYSEEITPVSIENADIYPLPFFESANVGERLSDAEAMIRVTDRLREKLDKSRVNILAAHCFAAGGEPCESDISARAAVGGSGAVPLSAFEGFDYVALGHIHRPQTMKAGNIIRYCGSPLKYSFSEAEQEKSFSVFDTDSKEFYTVPVPNLIPLRVIKGEYEKILADAQSDNHKNDYLKIILTDRFAGGSVYNPLKQLYPNLLQLEGAVPKTVTTAKISMSELSEMSPERLADMFITDRTGQPMNDEQKGWFAEALRAAAAEKEEN